MMILMENKTNTMWRMARTHSEIKRLASVNLKRLRESRNLTQTQLANMINSYPSTISAIEAGRQGLGKDLTVRICQALGVGAVEFTREVNGETPPPVPGELAVISMAITTESGEIEKAPPFPPSGVRYIRRPYDVDDPSAYAVEVRGDCMSPRYEEGELVIASPSMEVRNGDYAVVHLGDGKVTIKRVKFRDGLVILSSTNQRIQPWISKQEDVVAIHKVVWKKEK